MDPTLIVSAFREKPSISEIFENLSNNICVAAFKIVSLAMIFFHLQELAGNFVANLQADYSQRKKRIELSNRKQFEAPSITNQTP